MSAKYIMKCDDDTFVKVNSMMNEIKKVAEDRSVYIGNINYYHKPLRYGKWAVTYEVSFVPRLCDDITCFHLLKLINNVVQNLP